MLGGGEECCAALCVGRCHACCSQCLVGVEPVAVQGRVVGSGDPVDVVGETAAACCADLDLVGVEHGIPAGNAGEWA